MKDSFVFYSSFWEAVKLVQDAAERAQIFAAICEYALCGNHDIELSNTGQVIFTLIKPLIDANSKKYADGCKGGRPRKTAKKTEKTSGFENEKPNVNVNENENENENENVDVNENDAEKETSAGAACSAEKEDEQQQPENNSKKSAVKVSFNYGGDNKLHGIDEKLLSYWRSQFPEVDVPQELRNAEAWLESHPEKRKKNIRNFLLNWLIRSQKQNSENLKPPSAYNRLDGNTPEVVSEEERSAYDGF